MLRLEVVVDYLHLDSRVVDHLRLLLEIRQVFIVVLELFYLLLGKVAVEEL